MYFEVVVRCPQLQSRKLACEKLVPKSPENSRVTENTSERPHQKSKLFASCHLTTFYPQSNTSS